jgi:hypothetical protein
MQLAGEQGDAVHAAVVTQDVLGIEEGPLLEGLIQ